MRRLATGILCAFALQSALTFSAEARPRHHRHHHHHRVVQAPQHEPTFRDVPVFGPVLGAASDVVDKARSYLGAGAIFGRSNLWCARFMNVVLAQTGRRGTGSDLAMSFAHMPRTSMHVGAIAVMGRRGGGHVGIVSGITKNGDPIIISGNHGRRVAETVYPRSRIIAFVEPS